jgi:hypothetical protein
VLGGEPGDRQCLELLKVAQGGVAAGELLPELVVVLLQPGDLGVTGSGAVPPARTAASRRSNSAFSCG